MDLTDALLKLPAGGQVLLSDTTFQRIGGRLHEVKLPALQLPRPEGLDRPRFSIEKDRNSVDKDRSIVEKEGSGRTGSRRPSVEKERNATERQKKSLEGQLRLKLEEQAKQNLKGQSKGRESVSLPSSRRNSAEFKVKLDGQSLEGQTRSSSLNLPPSRRSSVDVRARPQGLEGQAQSGEGLSLPPSRRTSTDSTARLMVG